MGQLFEQKYPNNIRTVSGIVLVRQDDVTLLCDTSLGAVTIDLLGIPANYWSTQYKLYIVDKSNNASVNNITINAGITTDPTTGLPVPQKINGNNSVVINSNGGSFLVRVINNTNYVGQYSVIGGGGGGGYNQIQDEGVALPSRSIINFVGNNVVATDNGTKTVVTVGGLGVTTLTNAQYLLLQSTNSLTQGQFYLITDAQYTDGGVLVQAVNNNTPPSVNGIGLHLVADYQGVGNYSGVVGFAAWKNIWCLPAIPVAIGDVVVWNNLHYKNLTGVWGTAPDGDAVNWQVLPKSTTNGYILECDFVRYNVNINSIIYRADKRQNEVDAYADPRGVNLLLFQWGRNLCVGNKLRGASLFVTTNSYCDFYFNSCDSSDVYDETNRVESGQITYNILTEQSTLNLVETKGSVRGNTLSGSSQISWYGGSVAKLIKLGKTVHFNNLSGQSSIYFDEVDGDIVGNTLSSNSSLKTPVYDGQVSFNTLSSKGTIFGTIDITSFSYNNVSAFDINTPSISGSSYAVGYGRSTFPLTLDFSDPAVWDLATFTLTIPSNKDYCGVFTCVNTPIGIGVVKIVNLPSKHRSTFRPSSTDVLSFSYTPVGVAVANELCTSTSAVIDVLVGRTNGCDLIEFDKSGNLGIRINAIVLV